MKRVCVIIILVLVILGQSISAKSTIIEYKGSPENFVYSGDKLDLNDSFKNMMPGDSREQSIVIKNQAKDASSFSLKLAIEIKEPELLLPFELKLIDESTKKTVWSGKLSDYLKSEAYEFAPVDQGQELKLKLVISLDQEAKNPLAEQKIKLNWQIAAKKEPSTPTATGELRLPALALLALAGIIWLVKRSLLEAKR